jgi:hypothetical protein
LISCKNESEKKPKMPGNDWFSNELYSKLIDYQHLYPVPNRNEKKGTGLYVYLVSFYYFHPDTIVTIKRASDGVSLSAWNKVLGVYKNGQLLPTFIRDTSCFYSRGFIDSVFTDSASLRQFTAVNEREYPESFPPIYRFKVEKNKLILNRIDTVWEKW